MKQKWAIARGGNVESLVAAELDYLKGQGVRRVVHAGYSYGALKAMFASYYESAVEVEGLICIEPVAHSRGIIQLIGDFLRTDSPLNKYVNRSRIPAFIDARKHAIDGVSYRRGLIRPINLAIAFLLARTDFMTLLKKILIKRPAIHTVVAWGGKSELGNDAHTTTTLQDIARANPRVHALRFAEDTHALANDIHIHAAIILEALTRMR
jgi:pimeloyl-ACP methyl ester carboxylesterase